tara:strand:+ start:7914 stop:8339 length:426 start_codon:yes stop_codon:yes gene_type:complete
MAMTTKDKKRMIDVFFDTDKQLLEGEIVKAINDAAQLIVSPLGIQKRLDPNPKYTKFQQKFIDSDMTEKELRRLYKTYGNGRQFPQNVVYDKVGIDQEGKPRSLYFGDWALKESQRLVNSQAEADQFLLEQKIKRLKEDTI